MARSICRICTLLFAALLPFFAHAQEYPNRPVRIVVPYAPGGVPDVVIRLIGQRLSEMWKQPVVVDNRPGANGNLGTQHVARSTPDGYTLLLGNSSTHGTNATLYTNLGFDPVADFEPITGVTQNTLILGVPAVLPIHSVQELVAYARARPEKLNYGSYGIASSPHLMGALLKDRTGIDMVHVPYKGAVAALTMPQEPAPLRNYAALRYFHEVADAGSYRLASERLHVAASAIHRQVTNLEDELGTQLFERGRGRNRLRLTAAGEIFAHHYRRAMSEIALARTGVDALSGLYRGAVNFGINEGCSRELLPQLLSEFHATHPAVSFEITVASSLRLVELTRNDEIDFAVGYNPPARAGVTALARREIDSSVMMNRQHPLAARASLTTNSYDLLRQAACAGVGIAVLTQDLWGRESSPPDAVFIPLEDSRIAPQVIVCWTRVQRQLSVASLALIDAVKALLEKSSYSPGTGAGAADGTSIGMNKRDAPR